MQDGAREGETQVHRDKRVKQGLKVKFENLKSRGKRMRVVRYNLLAVLALLSSLFLLSGCGIEGKNDSNPSSNGLHPLAWAPTTPSQVDTGSSEPAFPLVVKEPDGGGTGLAVWIEQTDLDSFDTFPPINHLYARTFSGVSWAGTDSGCPFGNPDVTGNDGICVIDTGSAEFGAWVPQASMDNNGDAVIVWAQPDCIINPDGGSCTDYEAGDRWASNIYARRLVSGSWSATELIDDEDSEAFNPSLSVEPDGGGTAMTVWEQSDGTDWRIYARRFSGGAWASSDSGCPFGNPDLTGDDGICMVDDFTGPAHQPGVRMTNAGDAFVNFIQFANTTCYDAPTGQQDVVDPFPCPHNRLFYRTFTAGTWAGSITDFTPGTTLPSTLGCWDFLSSTGGETMTCSCGGWGCNCNTVNTPINTNSCRAISDTRLAMDPTALSSATVVYKSMESASPLDVSGDCTCTCGGWGCNCECRSTPPALTDTHQDIRIEAWRNTGGAGTTNNLDRYYYFKGSTNCSSTNPQDGDDFRRILNCDLDSPVVDVEPDGGGTRIAVWERYDGSTSDIVARQYSGGWGAATTIDTLATDAHAPQIAMDNAGDAIAVWVQMNAGRWRIYNSPFSGGVWGAPTILDGDVGGGSPVQYANPVVVMDGPGAALGLFMGFAEGFGFTLYGVTGP
jgi:hypothetical protein